MASAYFGLEVHMQGLLSYFKAEVYIAGYIEPYNWFQGLLDN